MKPITELVREAGRRGDNPAREKYARKLMQDTSADTLAVFLRECGHELPLRLPWESAEMLAKWRAEDARALENARRSGLIT